MRRATCSQGNVSAARLRGAAPSRRCEPVMDVTASPPSRRGQSACPLPLHARCPLRRFLPLSLSCALLLAACGGGPVWDGTVSSVGTLHDVLFAGHDEARIGLSGLAADDALVGVGVLERTAGEVSIVDGEVWVSTYRGGALATDRGPHPEGSAAALLTASVPRWSRVDVTRDVPPDEVVAWLVATAEAQGIATDAPFPFRIEGGVGPVAAHVIGGDCPMRARMQERPPDPAPYEVHAERLAATVVGFHATGRQGQLTHRGSDLHAHLLVAGDPPYTAHVESLGLHAGCTLLLPAR